jgi:hypothetical protein
MKVYFTTTAKGQHPHAAPHLIELGKKAIQSEFNQRYSLAKVSNDADVYLSTPIHCYGSFGYCGIPPR